MNTLIINSRTALTRMAILIAVFACAAACTQNHGYIGRLFGSWYLYDLTIDGHTPEEFGSEDLFFSFQSDLMTITIEHPYYVVDKRYGTWQETDDGEYLIVNFSHSDQRPENAQGQGEYAAPAFFGWNSDAPTTLHYIECEDKSMILNYTAPDSHEYIYYLRKTY